MTQLISQAHSQSIKREYTRVSSQAKERLIYMVINQRQGITSTANKMNIKLSAAKAIISKFKKYRKQQMKRKNQNNLRAIQQQRNRNFSEKIDEKLISCSKVNESQKQLSQFNLTSEYLMNAVKSHFWFTVNINFMHGIQELL